VLVQLIQSENDSGHSGARMGRGPAQILAGGAAERLGLAGHQVETVRIASDASFPVEVAAAFETARAVARQVRMASRQRRFPAVLAGNCMASLGAVAGHPRGRTGIVWLDAHADFHTPESTRSGFLDGMALATVAGRCWAARASSVPGFRPLPHSAILLLGTRDVEPAERALISEMGVPWIEAETMRSEPGSIPAAVQRLAAETDQVHLHLDLDVLDPEQVAPANEFAPAGGLGMDELLRVVSEVRAGCRIASATLASYDPSRDRRNAVRDAAVRLLEALTA
jgi:arginase